MGQTAGATPVLCVRDAESLDAADIDDERLWPTVGRDESTRWLSDTIFARATHKTTRSDVGYCAETASSKIPQFCK